MFRGRGGDIIVMFFAFEFPAVVLESSVHDVLIFEFGVGGVFDAASVCLEFKLSFVSSA